MSYYWIHRASAFIFVYFWNIVYKKVQLNAYFGLVLTPATTKKRPKQQLNHRCPWNESCSLQNSSTGIRLRLYPFNNKYSFVNVNIFYFLVNYIYTSCLSNETWIYLIEFLYWAVWQLSDQQIDFSVNGPFVPSWLGLICLYTLHKNFALSDSFFVLIL